jgi:hypothetical protein
VDDGSPYRLHDGARIADLERCRGCRRAQKAQARQSSQEAPARCKKHEAWEQDIAWADRIHALGNGVVRQAAAAAWEVLWQRHHGPFDRSSS